MGLIFMLLFGGAFFAIGGCALLASIGVFDMQVQGSEAAVMIVPPVFVLAGLGIVWLGVRGSYSAMIVGVENSTLFTENLAFGRRSGRKSIQLANIESGSVGSDVRSRRRTGGGIRVGGVAVGVGKYRERENEVVVRSDEKILRFGGALTEAEKTWLADACYYATLRAELP